MNEEFMPDGRRDLFDFHVEKPEVSQIQKHQLQNFREEYTTMGVNVSRLLVLLTNISLIAFAH